MRRMMPARARVLHVGLVLMSIAIAAGSYAARKAYIQTFFGLGSGEVAAPNLPALPAAPVPRADRLRVVLLDGVDATTARSLPAYDAVCAGGLELLVDVGFPTVSLPVQHVLWTGLTQQQTGVEFIGKPGLPAPRATTLPSLIPSSIAVADDAAYVTGSLGFATALPSNGQPWTSRAAFEEAATAAFVGDSQLALVHLLAADVAGHRHGRDSAQFRAAARSSDAFSSDLIAALKLAHPDGTLLLVLADHGHLAGGGHGGGESAIRQVRACFVGATGAPSAGSPLSVHLIDVARTLFEALGKSPDARCVGRVLAAAAAAPEATLPRPPLDRWLLAAILVSIALLATAISSPAPRYWPWWYVLAWAAVLIIEGCPTLSMPMVYAPRGRAIYLAGSPGLLVLALQLGWVRMRAASLPRAIAGFLALPLGCMAAALVLAGGAPLLLGVVTEPPLMPTWSAVASVALTLTATGALVCALAALASAVLRGSDRGAPRETPRTPV